MLRSPTHSSDVQKAFLDMFVALTGLPIGLYEIGARGEPDALFSEASLDHFEDHCRFIQTLPGGRARCEQDQCNRAKALFNSIKQDLTVCHAGMYNQAIPVSVNGEVRAVLLFGEMQLDTVEQQQEALRKHQEAVAYLHVGEADAAHLRELQLKARKFTPEEMETLKKSLPQVEALIYRLIDEEDRVTRGMEKVIHEVQTRLQTIMTNADLLHVLIDELSPEESRKRAHEIVMGAKALDTVVQNFGNYLGEYHFRSRSVADMAREARAIYAEEAANRAIDVVVRFTGANKLEVSSSHLQPALNNLVHNAIKYSFRGGPNRPRHVDILGEPARGNKYYKIIVENYGVGITPDELNSKIIFKDGVQGKLTKGEYRTGSGKGLAFVKEVIDKHHGQIEVTSKLMAEQPQHEGMPHLTRFTVFLPYNQPTGGQ